MYYLQCLASLSKEYLDEYDYHFAVHDYKFPVVGICSISIVDEAVPLLYRLVLQAVRFAKYK